MPAIMKGWMDRVLVQGFAHNFPQGYDDGLLKIQEYCIFVNPKLLEATKMSLEDIHMNTQDLLQKEELDAGGFGMVSLCYHKKYGLVVLKTVYTGPQRTEYNASLLEEGKIMRKLSHDRVVKLLGIILEDGNYSLVMEYVHKGNLMKVLKTSTIPLSVKGRFILEIIEGMLYLNEQSLVHKDLKPENILVDDDFHIKIADLGVACFKNWSRLTKEETSRQRKIKSNSKSPSRSAAGTLFYMAPEHLLSVNTKPVEKSDVYSFGIVLWAIFANKEPYENAINETHICFGIMNGNRPNTEDIKDSCPKEIIDLMKYCWQQEPENRPTFSEISQKYKPFYCEQLEKDVEDDLRKIKKVYPGPTELVKRMQSLQIDSVAESPNNGHAQTDQPNSLHSSQGLMTGNVDEAMFAPFPANQPVESCETSFEASMGLERKLQDELNYHKYGSRMDNSESQPVIYSAEKREEERRRRVSFDPFATPPAAPQMCESYLQAESTRSKASPYSNMTNYSHLQQPPPPAAATPIWENVPYNPNIMHGTRPLDPIIGCPEDLYGSNSANTFSLNKPPVPESGLDQHPQASTPLFPKSPNTETGKMESNPFKKGNFAYTPTTSVQHKMSTDEPAKYTIYNSTGIQIGAYNHMEIEEQNLYVSSVPVNTQNTYAHYENIGIFGSTSILSEKQLNLVRENLAKQWKHCARKLGFSEPQIDEIDHDYERDGLKEKVYQMLQKWVMSEGYKGPTVGKLARALYDCKRIDLLNDLIKMNQE
ncbi:receptor-interacting serine/threonine-protein kinase 1 isoform X2 [Trachemys scripta elegans]|uniref:receptor-interacting serine/threonine-protein kinase 1 isoform X2 n=2 Tax=Trachemys scripta elegans TaxID=31138 RepID=UPI001554DAE8|nr:receptor-interacting serine/threonine-protein kinase 1 isoform X2 [Trachemys scripta elegans]